MIFLANISEFTHEKFLFRIYGYHNTNIFMDKSTNIEKEVLSNLFQWTYSNASNISDKLGIFRNMISLFLINSKFNDITDDILSSCKSNYSIYLKENVERYIEVKNNQQVILNSIIDDIVSTCNVYKTSFKQSLLNIMTFFFSVVVLNVISTGGIDKIFTLEISILYIFLLVGFYFCRCIPFDKTHTALRLNGFVKRGVGLGRIEDRQGKESPWVEEGNGRRQVYAVQKGIRFIGCNGKTTCRIV